MRSAPLLVLLFFVVASHAQQEQKRVAILNTEDDGEPEIEFTNLNFLTGKLREIAVKVLPEDKYSVMSVQSIIDKMGSRENARKMCKEAQCIAEIGRKVSAAYVGQARLGRLDDYITINMELYNAGSGVLIGSFTGKAKKVSGLESVITENAPKMYGKMPGVSTGSKASFAGGISGLEKTGGGYELGEKTYLVNLSTEPPGAVLSFDGVPSSNCAKTPCKVGLREGSVRIIASLDKYEIADTNVSVTSNNQSIAIRLKSNFGVLDIKPAYLDGIGKDKSWKLSINDKSYSLGEIRLSPNKYAVKLSHECYENIAFDVGLNKDSREVFDMASNIKLKQGGLVLSAERNGELVSEPVFVNGKRAGETFFSDAVPLCAKIEIGEKRETVNVNLKYNDKVEYTHKLGLYTPKPDEEKKSGESAISIGSSAGYVMVFDNDFPLRGVNFELGAEMFTPLTDWVKIGSGVYIGYFTGSAKPYPYTYTAGIPPEEITISDFYIDLFPIIRLGRKKNYADIALGVSILSSEITVNDEPQKNFEMGFSSSLTGRYDMVGLGLKIPLNGNGIGLSASGFIPITKQIEIVPSIIYYSDELHLVVGFNYFL
ncbi:MAG: hypothetical protein LBC75_04395 [Fibromonadaceae bacterium]|jgi:hypothetical protein|nr:hypothetical protein [Fibromonadaceae bacterium]